MTTLLDARGNPIVPAPASTACPRCGRERRALVSGFGGTWRELCSWCAHEFASGTGEPPACADDSEDGE